MAADLAVDLVGSMVSGMAVVKVGGTAAMWVGERVSELAEHLAASLVVD